jgi:Asp-tRNA(Asn)/Glu-tRNA(Gln) amidotransferase C subunit
VEIKEDKKEKEYLSENDLREDEVIDCNEEEKNNALQQSSYYKDGKIIVKRILN